MARWTSPPVPGRLGAESSISAAAVRGPPVGDRWRLPAARPERGLPKPRTVQEEDLPPLPPKRSVKEDVCAAEEDFADDKTAIDQVANRRTCKIQLLKLAKVGKHWRAENGDAAAPPQDLRVLAELKAKGHKLVEPLGYSSANSIVVTTNGLLGAPDPRTRGSEAAGY